MSRLVKIRRDARVYRRTGQRLFWVGEDMARGSRFFVGSPEVVLCEHRTQVAVPFENEGQEYWILIKEMGVRELVN